MAVEYFPAKDEVVKQVRDLVYQNHHELVIVVDEILVMFRDSAPKENGVEIPFQVRKAPPLIHGMPEVKVKYEFFLILSGDMWQVASSFDKEAWLDSALCAMTAEEDAESGETKTKTRKPDVWGYRDAIDRYGMRALFPPAEDDQDRVGSDNIVTLLQGNDGGGDASGDGAAVTQDDAPEA